jgi:cyclophilin family peptidyl-prolyl cis-trans isomerase
VKSRAVAWLLALVGGMAWAAPHAQQPRVVIKTELGDIVLELYSDKAPKTVANFLQYVDRGLFRGGSFYRVVRLDNQPGAKVLIDVIQGGVDRLDNSVRLPPVEHETTKTTGILHKDGVISMARDQPGTADAEFFICIGDQPGLDFGGRRNPDFQGFAAFGRVVEGMDVVRAIHRRPAEGQMLTRPVGFLSVERDRSKDEELFNSGDRPSPWRVGFSERLRYVTWDNVETLEKEQNGGQAGLFLRTRLSLNWKPSARLDFGLRLANEVHQILVPSGNRFDLNEFFIDNLYVHWRISERPALDLTLGRQDVFLGQGLLVAEGTPLDETRSVYFNALRVDISLAQNQYLSWFLCFQPEKDEFLPVVNSLERPLVEQPEAGLGLSYGYKGDGQEAEGTLLYKEAYPSAGWPRLSCLTFSGRGLIKPLKSLSLEGEAALQIGKQAGSGLAAWGVDFESRWTAGPVLPVIREAAVGAFFLSGDNPESPRREGWQPLFSRWPKWSESYIFTLAEEPGGRLGGWTNIASAYARLYFELTKQLDLSLSFHELMAPESSCQGGGWLAGNGHVRGNLWAIRLEFKFSERLAGHLLYEGFRPGSYYSREADGYSFLRFELQLML